MAAPTLTILLIIFLVHLAVFVVLGLRRRQGYYLAVVVTFALLSAATAVQLTAMETVVAGLALGEWLRSAALIAAAVSLIWTSWRVWDRVRRRGDRTARTGLP
jgi:hypothetical protein